MPSDGVLFIENWTCMARSCADRPAQCRQAFVWSSGFTGVAARLRAPEGSRLSFLESSDQAAARMFTAWLRRPGVDPQGPLAPAGELDGGVWFWGDLDFSGLQILGALRRSFAGAQAWQPAYGAMRAALGGKQPGKSSCRAGDSV